MFTVVRSDDDYEENRHNAMVTMMVEGYSIMITLMNTASETMTTRFSDIACACSVDL